MGHPFPDKPRPRGGGRRLVGTIRTGLHTVTREMRRPSRYVPLMIVVGIGAFVSFGWPLVDRQASGTSSAATAVDEILLRQLVAVHRGATSRASLGALDPNTNILRFDTIPGPRQGDAPASFIVLRKALLTVEEPIAQAMAAGESYRTTLDGAPVMIRDREEVYEVLVGRDDWPHVSVDGAQTP